jgi:hypothetical protein
VSTPGHFHRRDSASRDRAAYRVKSISRVVAAGATAATGVLIGLAFHETPNHVKALAEPTASANGVTPTTSPPTTSTSSPPTTSPASAGTGAGSTLSPPTTAPTAPSVPVTTPTTSPARVVTGQT